MLNTRKIVVSVKEITLVFCALFLLCFKITNAQELTQTIDLSIQKTPENPKPGEVVTLKATSYSLDLSQTSLTWTYNGKQVSSGQGATSLSVVAPTAGSVGVVAVTASGTNFSSVVATTSITPGFVDLLWEGADAHTPPFYKGRPLIPVGGIGRVVAVPPTNGVFSFSWKRNGNAVANASGARKNVFVFKNTPFEPNENISVTVQSNTTGGESSLLILPQKPFFVAYKKEDGFIDYSKGSTEFLDSKTGNIVALFEPFFFSLPNETFSDLSFSVKNNDDTIYSDDAPNEFSFSSDSLGESVLTVSITPRAYSLQNISKQFTLRWNQ